MFHPKILTIIATLLHVCLAQKGLPSCRRYMCSVKTTNNLTEPYVFSPNDVDPTLCTHIMLHKTPLDGNKLKTPYWKDDKGPGGIYGQLKKMKEKNKRLKVLLTVGDHKHHGAPFSKMAATQAGRTEFINFLIPFLRERHFDGVNLDWYLPTYFGGVKSDKERYADLIQEMATAFERETLHGDQRKLILSAFGVHNAQAVNVGYNVTVFSRYVDMINIGTYNYAGYGNTRIGHLSPLDSSNLHSIKESVKFWVELGMPKSKINIGLAAYGRRVYTASSSDMTIGVSWAKGLAPAGKYTHLPGALAYYEICSLIKQGGKVHWDSLAHSPYHIQDNFFLTYENEESYKDKVRFAREQHLGGVAIRDLDDDDFKGIECGKGKFPLMKILKDECTKLMH